MENKDVLRLEFMQIHLTELSENLIYLEVIKYVKSHF